MEKFTHAQLLNLPLLLFSILTTTISPSTFARPLHNADHFISFFINNVLENTSPSSLPVFGNSGQLPFSEPTGLFTSRGGGSPVKNPNGSNAGFSGQARVTVGWLSFLTSLQALESGNVTLIEEELTGSVAVGLPLMGKVQGIYVTSLENNNGHMVAMRATFGNGKSEDSLRFFGEHRPGLAESHIAVVGGSGRYLGANGFAVVQAVGSEEDGGERRSMKRKLLFTVYIK